MTAFIIRKGDVIHSNAEIDVLEKHARRRVKVTNAIVLTYLNGCCSLYLNYTDGASGVFSTESAAAYLRDWSDKHKSWPKCDVKSVHAHFPKLITPILSPAPDKEKPLRMTRTRPVAPKTTKRISRVRK